MRGTFAPEEGSSLSLMHLLPDEMLGISAPLVTPGPESKAYPIISKYDEELRAPYKRLSAAHAALSSAMQSTKEDRLEAIIDAQAQIDLRHDGIIRGCWAFFDAIAELAGGEAGASILGLRGYLIPDGLSSQNKTYGGQAGQAEQLAARLTPDVRQRTDGFVIGEGANAKKLTAYLDEWIALGRQLNTYEAERSALESGPSEGAALHQARLDWTRAMNAMVSNAEMAGFTQVEMALVFGALQTAERKADERAREAKNKAAAEAKATTEKKAAEATAKEEAKAQGVGQGNG